MVAVLNPPKLEIQKKAHQDEPTNILLRNISWATYESLLNDLAEVSSPHLLYDRGDLLIMTLSPEHEAPKHTIGVLVEVLAEEFAVECLGFGSTTYKRKDIERGFEPDVCFYFTNEARMRGKKRLDMAADPPPELVIEIDVTHPSLDKLNVFAAFGVPEVWRYNEREVKILQLSDGIYQVEENSLFLPFVTSEILLRFIQESESHSRLTWLKRVRAWAREQQ